MSTRSLLYWAVLVAAAELAVRGYLLDRPVWLHGGAWLLFAACALGAWRLRGRRTAARAVAALALLPALLSTLTWAAGNPTAGAPDARIAFWQAHPGERALLSDGADAAVRRVELFGLPIALDARGFRALAPVDPSGARYRIVAVGGSSTFGATRAESERPWPELLRAAIEGGLTCRTPVEVINAGVLGRGIVHAANTFETAILPMDPQLILLDPSAKELALLARDLPELRFELPPPIPERASPPLRRLEERWRARSVASAFRAARERVPMEIDARNTQLAAAYRYLLVEARRHGVDVVLASLELAVTPDSPPAEIDRLEALEPGTRSALLGLDVHRRLVARMAATYRATFAEVPHVEGTPSEALFLDLHLRSERGRERLAASLLETLRPKLARDPPGCAPPGTAGPDPGP